MSSKTSNLQDISCAAAGFTRRIILCWRVSASRCRIPHAFATQFMNPHITRTPQPPPPARFVTRTPPILMGKVKMITGGDLFAAPPGSILIRLSPPPPSAAMSDTARRLQCNRRMEHGCGSSLQGALSARTRRLRRALPGQHARKASGHNTPHPPAAARRADREQ